MQIDNDIIVYFGRNSFMLVKSTSQTKHTYYIIANLQASINKLFLCKVTFLVFMTNVHKNII